MAANLNKAAEAGDKNSQFDLGLICAQGADLATAVSWWTRAAEQGHTTAQYNLGFMASHGQGAPQDYAAAQRWYKLSAGAGNVGAMYNLGVMFEQGDGVGADPAEAARWFEKAAALGDAQAQCNLGLLHFEGRGVERSAAAAARWWRAAADQGDAQAAENLALVAAGTVAAAELPATGVPTEERVELAPVAESGVTASTSVRGGGEGSAQLPVASAPPAPPAATATPKGWSRAERLEKAKAAAKMARPASPRREIATPPLAAPPAAPPAGPLAAQSDGEAAVSAVKPGSLSVTTEAATPDNSTSSESESRTAATLPPVGSQLPSPGPELSGLRRARRRLFRTAADRRYGSGGVGADTMSADGTVLLLTDVARPAVRRPPDGPAGGRLRTRLRAPRPSAPPRAGQRVPDLREPARCAAAATSHEEKDDADRRAREAAMVVSDCFAGRAGTGLCVKSGTGAGRQ